MAALLCAYFAYIGIFSPYLSLWLAQEGMSIAQIGILMSLPQVLRIVGPPAWGWAAGRIAPEHVLLRVAGIASALSVAGLFLADGFAGLALVLLLVFFATSGIVPIGEAITLRAVEGDAGRYGRVRLWGSVGFVLAVLAAGPLLDRFGLAWLPAMMLAAMVAVALLAWRLPASAPRASIGPRVRLRQRLREPAVAAFFASCFLMIFAHAGLYAFYSLYLEHHGYSRSMIGAMWALGVVAEIALFFWQRPLFSRVSALALLSASFLVCALRFGAIAWAGGALVPLLLAQLLHAVTYGVHHSASMAMLHRWFEGPTQARAQAAYVAIGYGLGGAGGGLAASLAWERFGPEAVFLLGAAAALAGWLAVVACRRLDYARRLRSTNIPEARR